MLTLLFSIVFSAPWSEEYQLYNLNMNRNARSPLEYQTEWPNHVYYPSPTNWRIPFYTLMLDRFADGNPQNNDYFKTPFEHDPLQVNFQHGGDVIGLINKLDYLQSLGIKGIYIAGTPFLNQPWDYHQYNPIDLTILDPHRGTVEEWRRLTDEVHKRGMVIMIDLTIETLGDLTYFEGYLNKSAPLDMNGYDMIYRSEKKYLDFQLTNEKQENCQWPKFYDGITGLPVQVQVPSSCYADDFAHYGDLEAFGNFKAWERQLTKFSGVQDRLKDWNPRVAEILVRLSCLAIEGLDIDAIRVDKATQMTLEFTTKYWSVRTRECAAKVGKNNFFIPGEITSGISLASMYMGKGRLLTNRPKSVSEATTGNLDRFSVRQEYGLDCEAFNYSLYRSYLAFVGLKGSILVEGDPGPDLIEAWNSFLIAVDYRNAYSDELDPRDLFSINNQDTFRWLSISQGLEKMRLGLVLTTLALPNAPAVYYGDDQGLYLHDSRSENYIYGRQPMTTSKAWQLHGCFRGNASYQFTNIQFTEQSRNGCQDDSQSMDHFNPTSTHFLFIQHLYHLRALYPLLQDSFGLTTLSKVNVGEEQYLWSVSRTYLPAQNIANDDKVWFLFSNSNKTIEVSGCRAANPIYAPYPVGTVVSDIFEQDANIVVGSDATGQPCLESLTLPPFGYKVLIPLAQLKPMPPRLVTINPKHDERILLESGNANSIPLTLVFSKGIDCSTIPSALTLTSFPASSPVIVGPGECQVSDSAVTWNGLISGVGEGVLQIRLAATVASADGLNTLAGATWFYRIGKASNVVAFPKENEFSEILQKDSYGRLILQHQAIGANLIRYSLDYERTWSNWFPFEEVTILNPAEVEEIHVTVEYWSEILASMVHRTSATWRHSSGPLNSLLVNRYPSFFVQGDFNLFGKDLGIESRMKRDDSGMWRFTIQGAFPMNITLDVYNDNTFMFGEVDQDGVLDRLPPAAQDRNYLFIPEPPVSYTAWVLMVDDRSMRWSIYPSGSWLFSSIYVVGLGIVPLLSALVSVYTFRRIFYPILVNTTGRPDQISILTRSSKPLPKVLIATLEYEIPDWNIKVRIGGLGAIASLMATTLPNELIWVVPKVGDVKYPPSEFYRVITVVICDQYYQIGVSKLVSGHVTYYLLESPLFRSQSRTIPYPERMDDIYSATFYSCWNQCIASIIMIENPDVYHVNDFHGAIAPIYLLKHRIVPLVLSLHNSEFQGLWPLRTAAEKKLYASIFDLDLETIDRYICFGHTFNMLHAASTYISYHQKGIGAGGVSQKYGKRCQKRYAILWGLNKMERLQNPNPTDSIHSIPPEAPTKEEKMEAIQLTQEWADLDEYPDAKILVFVGRLSQQKGIDLVADLAPKIFAKYDDVQLLVVGPPIDLYAKLAVEKLQQTSLRYPGRLCCRPEFTVIPECVYKAAAFVLLPSRDEPFGLVAVEFGRKGVLGIGSFVGGLGTTTGWYYPIESSENTHLLYQFWEAIQLAFKSSEEERSKMIHTTLNQLFPVEEWLENTLAIYQKVVNYDQRDDRFYDKHKAFVEEFESQSILDLAVDQFKLNSEKLLEAIEMLKIASPEEFPQFIDEDGTYFEKYKMLLDKEEAPPIQEFLHNSEKHYFESVQISQTKKDLSSTQRFLHRVAIRIVQSRALGWPTYAVLLLLGQILSSTSFQIALLAESVSLPSWEFYTIGTIFVLASLGWYWVYSHAQSKVILSIPFLFFGASFLFSLVIGNTFITVIPLLLYTIGSAAQPFYFALNFGQESGSKISLWIFRAMVGESCRQIWTLALWYWYSLERKESTQPTSKSTPVMILIGLIGLLISTIAVFLYYGLPRVYSQLPPRVPRFWKTLLKRRLVLWFWFSEIIKTYFLSGVFGRNWTFLWSHPLDIRSKLYVIVSFQILGLLSLIVIAKFSKKHSWFLPIFAVGLLSPRWSQMALGTSQMGFFLPWGGVVGPYVGISLWLWLGVMDMIQSAGLTIMLLQTLTRLHVVAVLMVSQTIGSVVQMIAKLTAPNRDGPSSIFPVVTDVGPLKNPWFWLGWISQVILSIGFLIWFRKEQLSKP